MTRCGLPLHDDKPALLPSAQHGAELALLRGTGTGVPQWRYPDCPERKGPTGTEVYDSAGAERLTGLRFKTAGENLQDDVVLIRLVLLGLRILVFLPLAFVAAEETQYYCADNK